MASEDFLQTAFVVPSLTPSAAAKADLRKQLRARRNAFVAGLTLDQRTELQTKLTDIIWPWAKHASVIAGYAARGSEIDPQMLLWHAGNALITTACPAFASATSPMVFRSGTCAEDCPVGGVQPPHQAKEVKPDLILVPLLAADRHGNRIGQGGGHYDRALPALRDQGAKIIGIGWAMQLLDEPLVPDSWDVRLDAFASPDGLLEFS